MTTEEKKKSSSERFEEVVVGAERMVRQFHSDACMMSMGVALILITASKGDDFPESLIKRAEHLKVEIYAAIDRVKLILDGAIEAQKESA